MKVRKKRTALVTGGARGIGKGIVEALIEQDFKIVIADKVMPEIGSNEEILFSQNDISDAKGRENIVRFCKDNFERLDLLVNNAGISVKYRGDMLEGGEESFDQLIDVNLKGPYFLTQSIARWMIEEKGIDSSACKPKIINIASLTSYASSVYMAEYALSKSAVSMMTKLYADRLSEYGINVYEIRPGIIKTNMTAASKEKYDSFISKGGLPISRWGLPEDVGKAVLAIANEYLPYSTGEVINVDGGFHLRRL